MRCDDCYSFYISGFVLLKMLPLYFLHLLLVLSQLVCCKSYIFGQVCYISYFSDLVCYKSYIFGLVCFISGLLHFWFGLLQMWPLAAFLTRALPLYLDAPSFICPRRSQKKHSKTDQFISNSFLCKEKHLKTDN